MGDDLALRRSPCTDLAALGAGMKIRLCFLARGLLDTARDIHLALQRVPPKGERHPRIGGEVASLRAVVIREKGEAAFVANLEQNGARPRLPGPAV